MRRPVSVAVTSVYGGEAPSPGLLAAQMLRRQKALDVRIIVLAAEAFGDGIQAVHVADRVVMMPPLDRDPGAFVEALGRHARALDPLVLLPGSANDTLTLASRQQELRRAGVRAVLPRAARLDQVPFPPTRGAVGVPRHRVVSPADRLRALGRPWRYPVAVRWAAGGGTWAHTPADLQAILSGGPPGVTAGIHETVAGTEISVAVLGADSAPADFVIARPLNVSEIGVVWSAVTMAHPRVVAATRRALQGLRWRGPAEARFVMNERGRLWFTGLTPGFPSWVPLGAAAGQDLVLQYVRLALGARPVRRPAFADGVFLARVSVDRPTTIDVLRQLVAQGEITHAASHARHLRTTAHHPARAVVNR